MTAARKAAQKTAPVTALILAADRTAEDPVRLATGAVCKAVAPVAGRAMLLRVLDALEAVKAIKRVVLCGPPPEAAARLPELREYLARPRVTHLQARPTPDQSVLAGLAAVREADSAAATTERVLLTTADHALLSAEMLEHFLAAGAASGADFCIGLARHEIIAARYPGLRRTVLRFRDAAYCGCNLYLINNARGRRVIDLWRRAQQHRKRPWLLLLKLLGAGTVLRYLCGRLSAAAAARAVSRRTGVRIGVVEMPFAQAGIDVDSAADLALVERILSSAG